MYMIIPDEKNGPFMTHAEALAAVALCRRERDAARRLLQISDGRAARLSGEVDELEARLELWRRAERGALAQMAETNERFEGALSTIAELEAALTDALYAWGLISELRYARQYHALANPEETRIYFEAEERIQRARLALPKTGDAQPDCDRPFRAAGGAKERA